MKLLAFMFLLMSTPLLLLLSDGGVFCNVVQEDDGFAATLVSSTRIDSHAQYSSHKRSNSKSDVKFLHDQNFHFECATAGHSRSHSSTGRNSMRMQLAQQQGLLCPKESRCDIHDIRNSFDTPRNYTFEIDFIVFEDGSPYYEHAEDLLPGVLDTLNSHYASVGVSFTANIKKLQLQYQNQKLSQFYVGAIDCDANQKSRTPCVSPLALMQAVYGQKWQQKGRISALIVQMQIENVGGYCFFPWLTELHGLAVLNFLATAPGSTTPVHEIGHYFGLYHTFRGISELDGCNDPCYETVGSDTTGDLCSDTAPMPLAYVCNASLLTTSAHPDPCKANRAGWPGAPVQNFMAYTDDTSCRNEFTDQQIMRMRCYSDAIMLQNMGFSEAVEDEAPSTMFSLFGTMLLAAGSVAINILV